MRFVSVMLTAALAGLALTGCSSGLFAEPMAMAPKPASDACGAQKLSYHLGHGLAQDVERDIRTRSGQTEVRFIPGLYRGPGNPQAARLDVYYHPDNRVINAMVCS